MIWFMFCQHVVKVRINKCVEKIYCKNSFSDRTFYFTTIDADIESLKSLRTLFDKYLDHMQITFEQNRMVRNIRNFEFFGKKVSQF